ncbi:acetyl-CoA carboxylase biotin carboxyl carrier protein [Cryptosporangium minutisporangium]|uniref:Biotin carboxyl carrier protein of acetyl-CoA carboxylase n=1 Tax=Cryptosporangium minutisporangium TaxID=113569 RepID=A0ABP6SRP3_9ACTN
MTEREELLGPASDADGLRVLREEVSSLVKTIPGPVASIALRRGDCSVEVTWASGAASGAAAAPLAVPAPSSGAASDLPDDPSPAVADPSLSQVVAPLVGTFYQAPEPGAAPFVREGDRVAPGDTIGIVEAMKLMNPIHPTEAGTVVEVLVADGASVEYGQPLVTLRVDAP